MATMLVLTTSTLSLAQQPAGDGNRKGKVPTEKQIAREKAAAAKQIAKNEAKEAKRKAYVQAHQPTDKNRVFLFGVGTDLNDSTLYVTEICELRAIRLEKKTKFLPYRAEFSLQLKEYLEGSLGLNNQTTCIFFGDKRRKVSRHYYKLKKRYLDAGDKKMVIIESGQFNFQKPDIDNVAM